MDVLIVVDMQNDFIDGALGTPEACAVVDKAVTKIRNFKGRIFFTRDTHEENYLETQEGRNLPVRHCIRGTAGFELNPKIAPFCRNDPFDKPSFGSIRLGEAMAELDRSEHIDSVTLIGLCTDICVISNAFLIKAFLPETQVAVDASCCAGVTPQSHRQALEAMKVCQIRIENEA